MSLPSEYVDYTSREIILPFSTSVTGPVWSSTFGLILPILITIGIMGLNTMWARYQLSRGSPVAMTTTGIARALPADFFYTNPNRPVLSVLTIVLVAVIASGCKLLASSAFTGLSGAANTVEVYRQGPPEVDADTFWDRNVEAWKISVRAVARCGDEYPDKHMTKVREMSADGRCWDGENIELPDSCGGRLLFIQGTLGSGEGCFDTIIEELGVPWNKTATWKEHDASLWPNPNQVPPWICSPASPAEFFTGPALLKLRLDVTDAVWLQREDEDNTIYGYIEGTTKVRECPGDPRAGIRVACDVQVYSTPLGETSGKHAVEIQACYFRGYTPGTGMLAFGFGAVQHIWNTTQPLVVGQMEPRLPPSISILVDVANSQLAWLPKSDLISQGGPQRFALSHMFRYQQLLYSGPEPLRPLRLIMVGFGYEGNMVNNTFLSQRVESVYTAIKIERLLPQFALAMLLAVGWLASKYFLRPHTLPDSVDGLARLARKFDEGPVSDCHKGKHPRFKLVKRAPQGRRRLTAAWGGEDKQGLVGEAYSGATPQVHGLVRVSSAATGSPFDVRPIAANSSGTPQVAHVGAASSVRAGSWSEQALPPPPYSAQRPPTCAFGPDTDSRSTAAGSLTTDTSEVDTYLSLSLSGSEATGVANQTS